MSSAQETFEFEYEGAVGRLARLLGFGPGRAEVRVGAGQLVVRFGPWRLTTVLANVASAELSGPYRAVKVAGPPRLSLADRGITFATTTRRGVCLTFERPVPGIEPLHRLRHPGVTVTVAEPQRLIALVRGVSGSAPLGSEEESATLAAGGEAVGADDQGRLEVEGPNPA